MGRVDIHLNAADVADNDRGMPGANVSLFSRGPDLFPSDFVQGDHGALWPSRRAHNKIAVDQRRFAVAPRVAAALLTAEFRFFEVLRPLLLTVLGLATNKLAVRSNHINPITIYCRGTARTLPIRCAGVPS